MLRCTDRSIIPALDNVTNAVWSADSSAVAMSRINVIPSQTTITGYEEQLQITVYYLGSGRVQELGPGSRPQWSGSGAYLSYWRDDGYLYVNLAGTIAGKDRGVISASAMERRRALLLVCRRAPHVAPTERRRTDRARRSGSHAAISARRLLLQRGRQALHGHALLARWHHRALHRRDGDGRDAQARG